MADGKAEPVEEVVVDPIEEVIKYVMHTPGNTNPAVLRSMIESFFSSKKENIEDGIEAQVDKEW